MAGGRSAGSSRAGYAARSTDGAAPSSGSRAVRTAHGSPAGLTALTSSAAGSAGTPAARTVTTSPAYTGLTNRTDAVPPSTHSRPQAATSGRVM